MSQESNQLNKEILKPVLQNVMEDQQIKIESQKSLDQELISENDDEFDWKFYLELYNDLALLSSEDEAYNHWKHLGKAEGRVKNKQEFYEKYEVEEKLPKDFNWEQYLQLNTDLQIIIKNELQAILHFLTLGIVEDRVFTNERQEFDAKFYLELYSDLQNIQNEEGAYQHWLNLGEKEGRIRNKVEFNDRYQVDQRLPKNFNWQDYLDLNPDLKQTLQNEFQAIRHFLTMGMSEGRKYNSTTGKEWQKRKENFDKDNYSSIVLFYPDYSKTNPYQTSLYSCIPDNFFIVPGTLDEAINTLKTYGETKRIIFHLHWVSFVLASAKNITEAKQLKDKFIDKLYLFLSLNGILVWTIHNTLPHNCIYPEIEIQLRLQLANMASKIHIHSKLSLPEIENFYPIPKDKVEFLHHGNYINNYPNNINREIARGKFGYTSEDVVFLFLGQLRPYKGIEDLISAFIKVHQILPKSYLLIAGKSVHPFKQDEIKNKTKIFPNIQVIEGIIPDEDLQWYFQATDIVVLPYRNILTSGSIINALSFSRPVIAPNVGMIREIIENGKNGLTYELGNIISLTQAMLDMAEIINQTKDQENLFLQCFQSVEQLDWNNHAHILFSDLNPCFLIDRENITIETENVSCKIWSPIKYKQLSDHLPKVTIVILNYNSINDTKNLVKSILKSSFNNFRIIIVDNNSNDVHFGKIINLFSEHIIIKSPKNLGYAGGNNLGIQYVKNHIKNIDTDFIWILNPDTVIKADTLEKLVLATQKNPEISIYGSIICWTQNPEKVWFGGGKIDVTETEFFTYHMYSGENKNLIPTDVYEVDYVTGASLFCHIKLFSEVGLIPEKYFLYFEETDWCLMAKQLGYKSAIIPDSQLYHSKASQVGVLPTKYYFYYYIRGAVIFMLKYFSKNKDIIKNSIEEKFIIPWLEKISEKSPQHFFYFESLANKALEHGLANITGKVNLFELFNSNEGLEYCPTSSIQGSLETVDQKKIKGWVCNKSQLLEPLDVTIKIDGEDYQKVQPGIYLDKMNMGISLSGYYGFELKTPSILFDGQPHLVEAWVDNVKLPSNINTNITLKELPPQYKGRIDGINNRHIQGWAFDENNPHKIVKVDILHKGEVILSTKCNINRPDLLKVGYENSLCGFLASMPLKYYDGQSYDLALRISGTNQILYTRSCVADIKSFPIISVESTKEMFLWLYHYREISMIHSSNRDLPYLKQIETWSNQLAYQFKERKQDYLVSIIMPAYNREKTIGNAISSVKAQNYKNWELIIIDDNSEDDTVKKVRDIINQELLLNIHLIELPINVGVSKARNTGLEKSQGRIIAYLDSDNSWDDNFLLIMVNTLIDHVWAKSAYCGDRIWQYYSEETYIDENCELTAIRLGHFNKSLLETANYIDLNIFVHWRDLYDSLGGFREDMRRLVDWELIVRYTNFAPPKFVPAILANYNMGLVDNQITRIEKYNDNSLKMIETLENLHKTKKLAKLFNNNIDNQLNNDDFDTLVIVDAYNSDLESLEICLQALIGNTNLQKVKIFVYLNTEYILESNNLIFMQETKNIEFRQGDFCNCSIIMADATHDLLDNCSIVYLSYEAVVCPVWLESLIYPTQTRQDVAIVIGRDIRKKNSPWAKRAIPYSNDKLFDIDVTLNITNNIILNLNFDESKYLIELSDFPLFCVYFHSEMVKNIDFSTFTGLDNASWVSNIVNLLQILDSHSRNKVVYTPESMVYHNSFFK